MTRGSDVARGFTFSKDSMSDPVLIEIIRTLSIIPGSIAAVAAAWFSYRASVHSQRAVTVNEETQRQTNGLKDELVSLTAKSSRAQGNLEGRAEEKAHGGQ